MASTASGSHDARLGKARKQAKGTVKRTGNSDSKQTTTIEATIDVGFGNTLFIRGQGGGLSWKKGISMRCEDACTWVWSVRHSDEPIVFKLLFNDLVWAFGEVLTVQSGGTIKFVPIFF